MGISVAKRLRDMESTTSKAKFCKLFNGCIKLTSVTMLATDVSADRALTQWLFITADNGMLYVDSTMVDDETILEYKPKNWEIKPKTTN